MIHPFGLTDIFLMRNLQRDSAALAIEQILTHPQSPLTIALTAPWPWAGVGVATYILDEARGSERLTGFAQLMKRAARPEADLLHVAPALPSPSAGGSPAEVTWRRLLAHCCQAAGGHGLQRIFASVPDNGPAGGCLRDAGFSLYTRETIYALAALPAADASPAGFRRQGPQDSWALQRLYTRNTPRLVQSAEGALSGEVGSPPLSWWDPDRWHGVVWEPAGEVRGAVQVHVGRAGHWLRLWGANGLAARELRSLVEQGLHLLAEAPWPRGRTLPVYATVRDYEIGVSGALTGFGFAPSLDRARFVKHTVAQVREPILSPLAALEARQEIPVHSQSHRT
ncbi:MAG: hypothetical protein NT169_19380 [Chloroflexi bacterium]|nr:hypothetical protein [Chloroflexota bacterium]